MPVLAPHAAPTMSSATEMVHAYGEPFKPFSFSLFFLFLLIGHSLARLVVFVLAFIVTNEQVACQVCNMLKYFNKKLRGTHYIIIGLDRKNHTTTPSKTLSMRLMVNINLMLSVFIYLSVSYVVLLPRRNRLFFVSLPVPFPVAVLDDLIGAFAEILYDVIWLAFEQLAKQSL